MRSRQYDNLRHNIMVSWYYNYSSKICYLEMPGQKTKPIFSLNTFYFICKGHIEY